MKRWKWILSAGVLVLSGCGAAVGVGSGGGGNNLASTQVNTSSTSAVRRAVIDVFGADGFVVTSQTTESATFTKRGGRSADITWGDLMNPNPVMINPTVTWRPSGATKVWVGCNVEISQASTVFGESTKKPLLMGKGAYNGMLRRVRKRVEGGG